MSRRPSRLEFDDFSGGIQEKQAADEFSGRQWARLSGFVLTDSGMRSQWPIQRLGTLDDVVAVRAYEGRTTSWLLALDDQGRLWVAAAPPDEDGHQPVNAVSWQQLDTSTGGDPLVGDPSWRFVCEMPHHTEAGEWVSGLLVHAPTRWSGQQAVVVYEQNGTLVADAFTEFYPSAVTVEEGENEGTVEVADGVYPRAAVGTMWRSYLVLGDIEWLDTKQVPEKPDDAGLSESTTVRYRNGLWISEPGATDKFNPLGVIHIDIGPPGTKVVALEEIDDNLLVFLADSAGRSGIVELRGVPSAPTRSLLRGGLGLPRVLTTTDEYRKPVAYWGSTGAVAFVADEGGVWHTNGGEVLWIDQVGPETPSRAFGHDHVETLGPYLFASRRNRWLCFRRFVEDGSWTELVAPYGTSEPVVSMSSQRSNVYFVQGGEVYRIAQGAPDSERGCVDGVPLRLEVGTQTLGEPRSHERKWFHRFAVRASGGTVVDVEFLAGPVLYDQKPPSMLVELNRPIPERDELVLQGPGPMLEGSALIGLEGDVAVEKVTWWVTGLKASR